MDFESLSADLRSLQERALTEISAASDPAALEALQIQYLGKKGDLTTVLRGIGSARGRQAARRRGRQRGRRGGEGSAGRPRRRTSRPRQALRLAAETVDVTLPGGPVARGSLHPIPETIGAIAEVFAQFGFVVYEGPEVEET